MLGAKFIINSKAAALLRPFVLLCLLPLMLLPGIGCGEEQQSSVAPEPKAIFKPGQEPGDVVLYLEVARTRTERARGLMERDSLAADRGMIFIFEQPTRDPFWMKNTYIPLSIAFVSTGGVILDIQDMEPLTTNMHAPAAAYSCAIEANLGFFSKNGLTAGDRVELQGI